MKYIFRTALLNRYAADPLVSREDLEEALIKAKHPRTDLDYILDQWTFVVDELIKAGDRQEDKVISLIREHYKAPLDDS